MPADPAYDLDFTYGSAVAAPAPSWREQPETDQRPNISVVPGTLPGSEQKTLSPAVHAATRIFIAAAVVLMVFAVARVTLNSSLVEASLETQQYSSQLSAARSASGDLEVTLASLSNPTRIKNEAYALGMGSSTETVVVGMPSDFVVVDAEGALSLSGSVAVLTASQSSS